MQNFNATETATATAIGSVDDYGAMVNMFERSGFTLAKSCSELLANSCDAKATHVRFLIDENYIHLIDNGCGMNEEIARNCLSLFRANHEEEQTMGVSGCGAKPAMYLLGNRQLVHILTHKAGEPFLSIVVPFEEMMSQRRYSNMIEMYPMDETLQQDFCRMISEMDRAPNHGNRCGTIIRFLKSEPVVSHITQQFKQSHQYSDGEEYIAPADRMSIIFGKMQSHPEFPIAQVDLVDGEHQIALNLYDYLGGNPDEYINRKEAQIEIYSRPAGQLVQFKFVMILDNGTKWEVRPRGAGYAKEPSKMSEADYQELQRTYGTPYTSMVSAGTRHSDFFNTVNVLDKGATINHDYDLAHGLKCTGKPTEQDFANYPTIIRNNQVIGKFEYENIKIATSVRGNPDTRFNFYHTRIEFRYFTNSDQLNLLDTRVVGIQANKNQYKSMMHIYHVPLTRLIHWFQVETSKQTKEQLKRAYPHLYSRSVTESDFESDSDSDASTVSSVQTVAPVQQPLQPTIQIPITTTTTPATTQPPAPTPVPVAEIPTPTTPPPLQPVITPPTITPQPITVRQYQQINITVAQGLDILNYLFHQTQEVRIFETTILKYREGYERDAVEMCFRYMTREQKFQMLQELIHTRHPSPSQTLVGGADLFQTYQQLI